MIEESTRSDSVGDPVGSRVDRKKFNCNIWTIVILLAYKMASVSLGIGPYLQEQFSKSGSSKVNILSLISTIGIGINIVDNVIALLKYSNKTVSIFINTIGCILKCTGVTVLKIPPVISSFWLLYLVVDNEISDYGIFISITYFIDYVLFI